MRKIERTLAFHVMHTSPDPFLAPTLRLHPPPPPALQFLPTVRAPHTPSLAIFLLFHVMHPVSYAQKIIKLKIKFSKLDSRTRFSFQFQLLVLQTKFPVT